MANYNELITAMEAVIKQNGNEEITGVILQNTLRAMIQVLGAECQFAGVATPQTVPGTPDYNVAFILGAGLYPNFNGASVQNGNIAIASNTGIGGAWDVEQIALIPNGTIVTAMIADDAITEDKIANNAVTENKINNGAVTENKINNNAVTENKIANNAVTENKIADDAVTTNKIKNKNVTREKLSDKLKEELDNKANIDGFYSTLGAGVAENLVGRGSVPAEYTFRTSGGDADLGSGTAQIKKLMGRTLAFNQKQNTKQIVTNNTKETLNGHKYLISFVFTRGQGTVFINLPDGTQRRINTDVEDGRNDYIVTSNGSDCSFVFTYADGESFDNCMLIDLTQMFGIGNEPSTVAEFESLFPLDYYAYNPGTLLSVNATGIKTVGFNQWDEQWEVGDISTTTGENVSNLTCIRSKNYIRVISNSTMYFKLPNSGAHLYFYNQEKEFLSHVLHTANTTFIVPNNAAYMRFVPYTDYGTTYHNDICINLSWSGYRNGEYEPYWESELPIPITTMTGKLNGAGASIAMFADGFKSAGNAFDEITSDKAVKRIGKVDLGTLDWTYSDGVFVATLPNAKTGSYYVAGNAICAKYENVAWGYMVNKTLSLFYATQNGVNIIDTAYSDTATFKTAMSGIYLYYEFATPEEYILDAEQPMNYRVDDFGTEMELPQNDNEPVTAPIRYDVQYAMNAVDTLRRLPENYISKESFADFLAEFDSKVGAAINATIVSTMTFNAETQKYGFNITITPNNP